MPSKKLTDTLAARAKAAKRMYWWDRQIPGFGLRVSGGSSPCKTWIVRYRNAARVQREIKLGRYPIFSADEARAAAIDQLRAVAKGDDPALTRQVARLGAAMTVAKLCERFETVRMPRMTEKTARMYRSMIKTHILDAKYGIGSVPVASVQREHVQGLVDAIAEQRRGDAGVRKVGQAKKVLSFVGTLFTFADQERLREPGPSPILGVRVDDLRREWELPLLEEVGHVFEPGESEKIWAALEKLPVYEAAADAIRLIMLTGVRKDEARLLAWCDVRLDGEDPHLAIRRHKTRKKLPIKRVPLSSTAADILRQRGPGLPQAWVFPARRDAGRPVSDLHAPWTKVREHVGLPKARLHDLRGLAARHLLDAGWSKEQVQAYMEWQSPEMVERYVRASKTRRREGAEVLAMGIQGTLAASVEAPQ
jgi:hypothetical protein